MLQKMVFTSDQLALGVFHGKVDGILFLTYVYSTRFISAAYTMERMAARLENGKGRRSHALLGKRWVCLFNFCVWH